MTKNPLSLISLASKAGKVASGGYMTEQAIISGNACFVIIAEDASDNTKKKFMNKCRYYRVPFVIYGNMDELGHLIGKEARTTVAVIDQGFGNEFKKRFDLKKDLEV